MTSTQKLDREGPLPLWAQLLTDLRGRLTAGEFADRFPTDQELVDEYQVSRHTVREAVRRIQADGILDRRRGRGTFVRDSFDQPLGSIYSLFRSVEATGVEQTSVVLSQERRAQPEVADKLGLGAGQEFFYLERLRLAGEDVLAIDRVWVPYEIGGPLLDADFSQTAIYDELRNRCHVSPESGTECIRPVVPTDEERTDLGLTGDDAAFLIERQTQTRGGPLEWRETLVRGDRYRFVVDWTPGRSEGLPLVEADDFEPQT